MPGEKTGAPGGTRTPDPLLRSQQARRLLFSGGSPDVFVRNSFHLTFVIGIMSVLGSLEDRMDGREFGRSRTAPSAGHSMEAVKF
jgi:hypothetical protein